jgi:hypothetical protein
VKNLLLATTLLVALATPALADDYRYVCQEMNHKDNANLIAAKIDACTRAIMRDPRDSRNYLYRGTAYLWKVEHGIYPDESRRETIADYDRAMKSSRNDDERTVIHFAQVLAYFRFNDAPRALASAEWLTAHGTDFSSYVKFLRAMIKDKKPISDSDLERAIKWK